jgi:hypothetical protein
MEAGSPRHGTISRSRDEMKKSSSRYRARETEAGTIENRDLVCQRQESYEPRAIQIAPDRSFLSQIIIVKKTFIVVQGQTAANGSVPVLIPTPHKAYTSGYQVG